MNRPNFSRPIQRVTSSEPATEIRRRALLSLSWYSSVSETAAHLALSRVSAPRTEGGPGFGSRVWVASRSQPAGPRFAGRATRSCAGMVRDQRAVVCPRRLRVGSGYIVSPFLSTRVTGHWSRSVAHKMPRALRAVATRATPGCLVFFKCA